MLNEINKTISSFNGNDGPASVSIKGKPVLSLDNTAWLLLLDVEIKRFAVRREVAWLIPISSKAAPLDDHRTDWGLAMVGRKRKGRRQEVLFNIFEEEAPPRSR
jgi:hypothetical protein